MKYLLILISILFITGCDESFNNSVTTELVVKSIKSKQNFAIYSCVVTYSGYLVDQRISFADSIGKFNINDTLIICKKRNYEKTNN